MARQVSWLAGLLPRLRPGNRDTQVITIRARKDPHPNPLYKPPFYNNLLLAILHICVLASALFVGGNVSLRVYNFVCGRMLNHIFYFPFFY